MNECDFVGITLAMIIKNNISFEYYYSSQSLLCQSILSQYHTVTGKNILGVKKRFLKKMFSPT